ncbi:MAG: tetratricopeptide repeat protein [Candidatus Xenobiia bacterium LiM19]
MAGFFDRLACEYSFLQAAAKQRKGELSESISILEKARAKMPSHTGILIATASGMMDEGRYDEASEVLREAGAIAPENPVVQQYLGIICLQRGDINQAERHFIQARDLEMGNQLTRNYCDLCSIMKGDVKKGIAGTKKDGVYSNTRYAGFLSVAVESLLVEPSGEITAQDDRAAAPEETLSAASEAPEVPEVPEAPEASQAPEEQSPPQDSASAQTVDGGVALQSEPQDIDSKNVETLTQQKNPYGNEPFLIRILVNPFVGLFYWFLGLHYLNRNSFDKASRYFDRSALISPDTQRIHFYRGEAHFYNKDLCKALEAFRESYNADGENADVLFFLGKIAQEEGRIDEAEQHLTKSYSLFPKAYETLYSLGQIMVSRGEREKARKYFEDSAEYDFSYLRERMDEAEKKCGGSENAAAGEKA